MSDEQINIAIAEACGWAHPSVKPYAFPDYCNCLNAMHEAENVLGEDRGPDYIAVLCEIIGLKDRCFTESRLFALARATARQRAEAFLKTIGKWEDWK